MDFQKRIIELMAIKNWNQTQIAKAGGVTQGTISRYLRGNGVPDAEFILNLYTNENVNPLWFFIKSEESSVRIEENNLYSENIALIESETKFRRKIARRPGAFEFLNEILDLPDEDIEALRVMVSRFKK